MADDIGKEETFTEKLLKAAKRLRGGNRQKNNSPDDPMREVEIHPDDRKNIEEKYDHRTEQHEGGSPYRKR